MDFDVFNQNNEKLADITDLIYDWQNGFVSYMLIDYTTPAADAPAVVPDANAPADSWATPPSSPSRSGS